MKAGRNGTVPVGPFQERYHQLVRQGYTTAELARWAGYTNRNKSDPSRMLRALGLRIDKRSQTYTHHVHYETAVRLADAFGMDPVDADI